MKHRARRRIVKEWKWIALATILLIVAMWFNLKEFTIGAISVKVIEVTADVLFDRGISLD